MKKALSLCIVLLITCIGSYAQHTLSISVKNADEKEPLIGATVSIPSLQRTIAADATGLAVFTNLAEGMYKITVSFVGFKEQELSVSVPQPTSTPVEVFLAEAEEHEHDEEVVVTATRTSRTIANTPTRVEVISGEELDEKANM